MGMFSWRCAKTTQGITIMRYEMTEVIAFLPDGKRISGFMGNYGELIQAEYVNNDGQPLPPGQNLPENESPTIFDLYAPFIEPKGSQGPDGAYSLDALERMEPLIKLVRVEEVEPTDSFESLPASERCPWQGFLYDSDDQWKLPLTEALKIDYDSFQDEQMSGPQI